MGAYITDQHRGHSTTPGATSPTLARSAWILLGSPANQYRGNAGDGLSSFSEETRTSNHLQVLQLRQQILHNFFKTLTSLSAETRHSHHYQRTFWGLPYHCPLDPLHRTLHHSLSCRIH